MDKLKNLKNDKNDMSLMRKNEGGIENDKEK